jgi:transposase
VAGITITSMYGTKRIFSTISYRDNANRPRNHRKLIGKLDINSNKIVFNKFFKNITRKQGIKIEDLSDIDIYKIPSVVKLDDLSIYGLEDSDIDNIIPDNSIDNAFDNYTISNELNNINDNVPSSKVIISINDNNVKIENSHEFTSTNYGHNLIIEKIIDDTGLLKIVKEIFPDIWSEIITLSSYFVLDNRPSMYCHSWTCDTETVMNRAGLQSQRISELFENLTYHKIMTFYELWATYRSENEYLALDITSISSYSNLINIVENGYNRDGEKLKQINLCMLYGERSGLPVFSSVYPGSINDVKILKPFIEQLEFLGNKKYKLVMDKGFYSSKNIECLLTKYQNFDFLISIPFTTAIAKEIVLNGSDKFDSSLIFRAGQDILHGYSFIKKYNFAHSLKYNVYFNKKLNSCAYDIKEEEILDLKECAVTNPDLYKNDIDYTKYLTFNYDKINNLYNINIKVDRLKFETKNKGWLIVVGNDLDIDYKDVISIYRNKDVVEKAFDRLKNNLDLNRLRISNDNKTHGKLFIIFLSLIIISYIHNIMSKNELYKTYTLDELLGELSKIKLYKCGDLQSISPISKTNRKILEFFDIKIS